MVEVETGKLTKVDTDNIYELNRGFSWSGDSRWIAFMKSLPNRFHAIYIYSLETGKSTQLTDGMSDARSPVFDKDGQYLYFTASTNYGPTTSGLDMTSDEHEVTSNIYIAVLPNNIPSPVGPESDEEGKNAAPKHAAPRADASNPEHAAPKPVRIDFDKLSQRIVALPVPARNYLGLEAGKAGVLYILESGPGGGRARFGGGATLSKYDLKTRKLEKLADGLASFDLSANGEKMLIRTAGGAAGGRRRTRRRRPPAVPQYFIVPAGAPVKPGEGALRLAERGGQRRPARRVEADVPRGLANRAQLLLRSRICTASTWPIPRRSTRSTSIRSARGPI